MNSDYDPETGYPLTGPTELESAWWQHHIVSKGYPRARLPKVISGQMTIENAIDAMNIEPWSSIEARPDGWYVNGEKIFTEPPEEDEVPDWRDEPGWQGEHFTGQD